MNKKMELNRNKKRMKNEAKKTIQIIYDQNYHYRIRRDQKKKIDFYLEILIWYYSGCL